MNWQETSKANQCCNVAWIYSWTVAYFIYFFRLRYLHCWSEIVNQVNDDQNEFIDKIINNYWKAKELKKYWALKNLFIKSQVRCFTLHFQVIVFSLTFINDSLISFNGHFCKLPKNRLTELFKALRLNKSDIFLRFLYIVYTRRTKKSFDSFSCF